MYLCPYYPENLGHKVYFIIFSFYWNSKDHRRSCFLFSIVLWRLKPLNKGEEKMENFLSWTVSTSILKNEKTKE